MHLKSQTTITSCTADPHSDLKPRKNSTELITPDASGAFQKSSLSSSSVRFLPEAESLRLLRPSGVSDTVARLNYLLQDYTSDRLVIPSSVAINLLEELIAQGMQDFSQLQAAKLADGTIVIRALKDVERTEPIFAILPPEYGRPVVGKLTNRGLTEHWPNQWQNYSDLVAERVLDHCCGLGLKVKLLRELGIEAFGVDITAIDPNSSSNLFFGRAEKLPFPNGYFKRVESRMGVMTWNEDDVPLCRQALAEMIRVTADSGTIRISPIDPELMNLLASERTDIAVTAVPNYSNVAFEIQVLLRHFEEASS